MVKKNRSTLHTVYNIYNIQQSATQGSNDTTHRLSRRTAATTRFSPEGRLPKTDGAKVWPTSDQVGHYLASIHQMAPPDHTLIVLYCTRPSTTTAILLELACAILLIYRHTVHGG